jgi:hypothetical protein
VPEDTWCRENLKTYVIALYKDREIWKELQLPKCAGWHLVLYIGLSNRDKEELIIIEIVNEERVEEEFNTVSRYSDWLFEQREYDSKERSILHIREWLPIEKQKRIPVCYSANSNK